MAETQECVFLPNKPEKNGYVRVGRGLHGRERAAHRQAYVDRWGPIPEGWTIDHECHNRDETCPGGPTCPHRACVNPEHLVAKPAGDNSRASRTHAASINLAKDKCAKGHEFTFENTYVFGGQRQCRMCKLLDHQRRHARRKAAEWGVSDILGE